MASSANSRIGREIESTPINTLVLRYSIPAILSNLVTAIYNMVDQIFIGWDMGVIGNSATNVSFPLVTLTTSVALLFGIGSAANMSISLGKQDIESAKKYVGNAIVCISLAGLLISVVTILFTREVLTFFGATEQNIEYAITYTRIIAIGYPFSMFNNAMARLIRADGSPRSSMVCILSGALLNCILNPIFIFTLDMGIAGAAYATIIGQMISTVLVVKYLLGFKTFPLTKNNVKFNYKTAINTSLLGMAPAINQLSMTISQVVMNNVIIHYGAQSIYGQDIPLACVGIITKISTIYMMIVVGVAQGTQPIIGYNYGAAQYEKVMDTYKRNFKYALTISVIAFILFQTFPRQIISIFGTGSEEYFLFAERYFRIYLFMTFLNGVQPMTGNFLTSVGRAYLGSIVSLTKQILFLVPLLIILPMYLGLDGVLYAGPIADFMAFTTGITFIYFEFKRLKRLELLKTQIAPIPLVETESMY